MHMRQAVLYLKKRPKIIKNPPQIKNCCCTVIITKSHFTGNTV